MSLAEGVVSDWIQWYIQSDTDTLVGCEWRVMSMIGDISWKERCNLSEVALLHNWPVMVGVGCPF